METPEPTPTAPTGIPAAIRAAASAEPRTPALERLLGQAAAAELLAAAFGKDPFRTRIPADAARRLFDWPRLNAALAEHRLAPPRMRLERAGADDTKGLFATRRTRRGEVLHDLDAAELNRRLRTGATLIVDSVNELSAPLREACAGLAADFGCSCQANLYACWGTTQGFDVHWDDHDVLVVQVEGEKRWALYGQTREAPTRRDLHAQHAKPETPLGEMVLTPGDVLYLPRGYWHAAVGLGGPTLHLTIGLTRKTGADFLHWLADHLLGEPEARRDLRFELGDVHVGAQIGKLLEVIAQEDPARLGRLYRRHVEAGQAFRPEVSFPDIGADAAGGKATYRMAAGAARVMPGAQGQAVLSWRGVELTVDAELAEPLGRLTQGAALSYGELAAALPAGKRDRLADFLDALVQRGVLIPDVAS